MDYNEWREKYKPIELEPWSGNYLLETYGHDLELVQETSDNRVWTLIDGDGDGRTWIVSGCHHVNRIAYIITKVPIEDGEFIEVLDD